MGALDDFKLYFEKLPDEGKVWLQKTLVRVGGRSSRLSDTRLGHAVKLELDRDIPTLRFFKRLYNVEAKLDKPFLYDSELLRRIERLETRGTKSKGTKRG